MKKLNFKIEEKECVLYTNENKKTEYILIQPVDEHDMQLLDNEVKYISENTDKSFSLAAFKIEDWNSELTPWEMPLLRGKGNFGDGAGKTLEFIREKLIPNLVKLVNIQENNVKYVLGGYSLAGLFSLWCGYQTDIFAGVVGVSPSVWYKDWIKFVKNNEILAKNVYLSLGDLEEKTKHQVLSKIGDNIREYFEIFLANMIKKDKDGKIDIIGMNLEEMVTTFVGLGLKKFNATQVFDWIHNKMVFNFDEFSNISKKDREFLKEHFYIAQLTFKTHQISDDKDTEKFLFELSDHRLIESVLISHKNRHTLCVSSQIGCLIGCDFCATATMTYERNLSASEILLQFYYVQKYLSERGEKLGNVVYMGMGEPFLNYDNVIESINILNSPKGQNFSKRNFTVSTSGIVTGIEKFTENESQVNLAISLHSVRDDRRTEIMPINKRWGVQELKKALINYQKKTKNRITFEYILIDDFNCEYSDAFELADYLRSFSCLVNLIPYNPVKGKIYKTPSKSKQREFYKLLKDKNINVTLRETKGQDIAAACGQLKAKKEMENGTEN